MLVGLSWPSLVESCAHILPSCTEYTIVLWTQVRCWSQIQGSHLTLTWNSLYSETRRHQLATFVSQLGKTPLSLRISLVFNSTVSRLSGIAAGPAFESQLLSITRRSQPPSLLFGRAYAKRKMPPKKQVKEEKVLLGRPGNNLKSGIVCKASEIMHLQSKR